MRIQLLLIAAVVSGCAVDEPATDSIALAASVHQWQPQEEVPSRTTSHQVGLAEFQSRLYMTYKDDDSTTIKAARFDGTSWVGLASTGQTSSYGPALTVFRGKLTSVYHAAGENRLMMSTSTGGTFWTTPVTAGTSLNGSTVVYAPALTVRADRLYVAYCKVAPTIPQTTQVRIDRFDGTAWSFIAQWETPSAVCKGVAIANLPDGNFQVVWNVEAYNGNWPMYQARGIGTPSSSWPVDGLPMYSKKPPSLLACGGDTHLVHGGGDTASQIWWTAHEDGDWLDDERVPGQASSGGAALGCLGGRAFLVHNGSSSPQVYSSEWGP